MNKKTQELAKLITENPELDVVFMWPSPSKCSDYYYPLKNIRRVYVGLTADYGDHSFCGENKGDVKDQINEAYETCDYVEPARRVFLENVKFKKVIVVELEAV